MIGANSGSFVKLRKEPLPLLPLGPDPGPEEISQLHCKMAEMCPHINNLLLMVERKSSEKKELDAVSLVCALCSVTGSMFCRHPVAA